MDPATEAEITAVEAREAAFNEWYIAQFGKRHSERSEKTIWDLIWKAKDLESKLFREMHLNSEWETRREAALVGWMAGRQP